MEKIIWQILDGYKMDKDECKKKFQLVDMMLTMYSIARDTKMRWSRILDILLLAGSTLLLICSVIDPKLLTYLGKSEDQARFVLGIFSSCVFFFSIISMLVSWKGDASKYAKACESLSSLKADFKLFLAEFESHDDNSILNFMTNTNTVLSNLPGISENKFHKYKQIHKRKIVLSKIIDNYPGSPILFIKAIQWYNDNKKLFINRNSLTKL